MLYSLPPHHYNNILSLFSFFLVPPFYFFNFHFFVFRFLNLYLTPLEASLHALSFSSPSTIYYPQFSLLFLLTLFILTQPPIPMGGEKRLQKIVRSPKYTSSRYKNLPPRIWPEKYVSPF